MHHSQWNYNILWCTEVIIYLSWAVDENDVRNSSTTSAVFLTATMTLTDVATATITATAENVTLDSNGTTVDVFSLLRRGKPWDFGLLKKILLILGVVAFYAVLITFMISRGLIPREKKKEPDDPEKQLRGSSIDTQRSQVDRSTSQPKVMKTDSKPNGSTDIETEAKNEQKRTDEEKELNEGDSEEKIALREPSGKMS
ncbi:hypothetical protein GCK32_006643 [Trichostrongylus colubriformis]|uniref:Uncharacterized protein n=1 Tax=Trichostrongylus colubriformis TaxID=6319 RepID=A0AAN8FJK7_TRICO